MPMLSTIIGWAEHKNHSSGLHTLLIIALCTWQIMKNIENGHFHHTLVSALSCVLLMAVAGGISEHMLT